MSSRRLSALAATTAAVFAGQAGAASAATMAPLEPCYWSNPVLQVGEPILLVARGFSPNAQVDILLDGAPTDIAVTADAAGNFPPGVKVGPPIERKSQRAFTLSLVERGNTGNTVSFKSLTSLLSVGFRPKEGSPRRRVTFAGRGFTRAKRVYLHYRYKGRTKKRVDIRAKGPCGTFRIHRRLFPFPHVATGEWRLQFDHEKAYRREPGVGFLLPVVVSEQVRTSRLGLSPAGRALVGG